jgi:sec-independent protein translocase protein TatB
MFDVGFWEILLILILALVVIGPERLPGAARKAGYFVGKARRYIEGVRSEVESELDVNEFKRMLHNQEVQINELQEQIKSGVNDVKSDVSDATSATAIDDTETHSFHDELSEDVGTSVDTSAKTESSSNKENS